MLCVSYIWTPRIYYTAHVILKQHGLSVTSVDTLCYLMWYIYGAMKIDNIFNVLCSSILFLKYVHE